MSRLRLESVELQNDDQLQRLFAIAKRVSRVRKRRRSLEPVMLGLLHVVIGPGVVIMLALSQVPVILAAIGAASILAFFYMLSVLFVDTNLAQGPREKNVYALLIIESAMIEWREHRDRLRDVQRNASEREQLNEHASALKDYQGRLNKYAFEWRAVIRKNQRQKGRQGRIETADNNQPLRWGALPLTDDELLALLFDPEMPGSDVAAVESLQAHAKEITLLVERICDKPVQDQTIRGVPARLPLDRHLS